MKQVYVVRRFQSDHGLAFADRRAAELVARLSGGELDEVPFLVTSEDNHMTDWMDDLGGDSDGD